MKNTQIRIAAIAFIILGGSAAAFAGEEKDRSEPGSEEAALMSAAISLRDAVRIAEDAGDGRALSGEFEEEDGVWAYSIEVLRSDNQELELVIDAATGEVLDTETDD